MIATSNNSFTSIKTITSSTSQSIERKDGSNVENVKQSIDAYTSWLSQSGKAESTVRRVGQLLTAIVHDCMGVDFAHELDLEITTQFLEHQQDHGYAGKTVRSQLSELKRFTKWLVRSGRSKFDSIAKLTFDVDESESIDRAQFRFARLFRMIEFVSNHRLGVTLEMLNEVCSETSKVCLRTTRRDVELLITIGAFRKNLDMQLNLILIKTNPFSRISQLSNK